MKNYNKKAIKPLRGMLSLLILPISVFAGSSTVYEDAESGLTTNWSVYTNTAGVISNEYDTQRGSKVIKFAGNGLNDGYMLGGTRGLSAGRNTTEKNARWSMKYSEDIAIYIKVATLNGSRTLLYTNIDTDRGLIRGNIHHGLGVNSTDGTWQTFNRDLESDLKDFEPTNKLLAVNAFLIRGSGSVDDLMLISNCTTYEDAEDEAITGWTVYTNLSGTAMVSNVYDADKDSQVIELTGIGLDDGAKLGDGRGADAWANSSEKNLKWSMNYSEDVSIYIALRTAYGTRYLRYTNSDTSRGLDRGNIHHGLGANIIDGTWHTFNRDLEADVKAYEPTNTILAVNAFMIRGAGRVDDIMLCSNPLNQPVITLSGNPRVILNLGDIYVDAAATASDIQDGSLTSSISTVNPVDTTIPGTYTITYDVNDSDGIWAEQVTREVIVIDPTINNAPTVSNITMVGTASTGSTLTLNYTFDDIDGDAEGTPIIAWSTPTLELQRGANSTFVIPPGYEGDSIGAFIIVTDEHNLSMDGFGYADNNYLTITAPQ